MKQCSACKQMKDESEFSKCGRAGDGLQYKCKNCYNKYNREYYKTNDECKKKHLIKAKKWNGENPKRHKKYLEDWHIKNPKRWREIMVKSNTKRERNYGFSKLIENPFTALEAIAWHHIDDDFVVPIPQDIHQHFGGCNTAEHRELLEFVVLQVMGLHV